MATLDEWTARSAPRSASSRTTIDQELVLDLARDVAHGVPARPRR